MKLVIKFKSGESREIDIEYDNIHIIAEHIKRSIMHDLSFIIQSCSNAIFIIDFAEVLYAILSED